MSAAESSSRRFLVQMMCKSYAVKIGQKQLRTVIIPHFSVGANLASYARAHCTQLKLTLPGQEVYLETIKSIHYKGRCVEINLG